MRYDANDERRGPRWPPQRSVEMQKMGLPETARSVLPKFLVLIATLVLALGFCELGLRFLTREPADLSLLRADDFQALYFEPDPVLGIVRRANLDVRFRFEERPSGFIHFQTNNLGLRRATATSGSNAKTKRILVLGDSQIDGSVDNRENVCSILETRLSAGAAPCEILNAATGSYSPFQCYLWYRTRGRALAPDAVFLTVFLGNDLAELVAPGRPRLMPEADGSFHEFSATEDYQRRMKTYRAPSAWMRLRFFLLQNSVLFGRLNTLAGGSSVDAPGPMGLAYRNCIGCTGQSLGQDYWFKHHPQDIAQSLSSLEELLRRLRRETAESGSRLLVIVLPSRFQVEPEQDAERIRETARILGLTDDDLAEEHRLGQQVVAIGRELDIETLDLGPSLRAYHDQTGENLYYQTDWHLNGAGHRVLADQLYPYAVK